MPESISKPVRRYQARVGAPCQPSEPPRRNETGGPTLRLIFGSVPRRSKPPRFNDGRLPTAPTPRDPPRPTVPDAPSRRGVARSAAPCYPRVLRLSPAVLNPRCHATPSPPSPPNLPRSPVELPRSSGEVPRWVFKLPRSDPKVPRSGLKVPRSRLKVPRSVSVLPRFAAMLGFAFPCAMGVFIPVAPVGFC